MPEIDLSDTGAETLFIYGQYAYVGHGTRLGVWDLLEPATPTQISHVSFPEAIWDIDVVGDYAYVTTGMDLYIVDISDPAKLQKIGHHTNALMHEGKPRPRWYRTTLSLEISGSYAYVGWGNGVPLGGCQAQLNNRLDGFLSKNLLAEIESIDPTRGCAGGIQILDVSNPITPTEVATLEPMGQVRDLVIQDQTLYLVDDAVWNGQAYVSGGLRIIDITDPLHPSEIGFYDSPGRAYGVAVAGQRAYVADFEGGLRIIDISIPATPTELGFIETLRFAYDVTVIGSYAYVADGDGGVHLIEVTDPANPSLLKTYATFGFAKEVTVSGAYAYIANRDLGLVTQLVDVPSPRPTQPPAEQDPPISATATPTPVPIQLQISALLPANPLFADPDAQLPPMIGRCPTEFAEYIDLTTAYVSTPQADLAALLPWLQQCCPPKDETCLEVAGRVYQYDLQSDSSLTVLIVDLATHKSAGPEQSLLLIYHKTDDRYALIQTMTSLEYWWWAGFIGIGDINDDGVHEILWTDSTCGAHTCSSNMQVGRWNGTNYETWNVSNLGGNYPSYTFMLASPPNTGQNIVVYGGRIGSVGAGIQRSWTTIYVSPEGGPYERSQSIYDFSSCLYFHVTDANTLFDQAAQLGFQPVIAAYEFALNDLTLRQSCFFYGSDHPDPRIKQLLDYIRYRLVVAYTAVGQSDQALRYRDQITITAIQGAADTFLQHYQATQDVVQACAETTNYAEANPDSWQFLADWGYANPGFSAIYLCPIGRE